MLRIIAYREIIIMQTNITEDKTWIQVLNKGSIQTIKPSILSEAARISWSL